MKKSIKFHYFYNESIGSWLIKARLSTVFSHVGIEFEDGMLYHSAMLKGTVKERLEEQKTTPIHTTEILVDEEHYNRAYEWAQQQLGKRYDWLGIVGFIVGNKWNDDNQYFCSEYGKFIFELATDIKHTYYNLLTPGQLRLITDTFVRTNPTTGNITRRVTNTKHLMGDIK